MNPPADSAPGSAAAPAAALPFDRLLTAISERTRWRILRELIAGEALPVSELARRLGAPATNISKHAQLLQRCGVLERGYGMLYRIAPRFAVPGEPATLDFGAALIRLDRMPG
jgi:DNA-binding transcriptional ArsR family regulator